MLRETELNMDTIHFSKTLTDDTWYADILKSASFDFPILFEVKKTDSKYKDTEIFLKAAYSEAVRFISKFSV